MSNITLVELNHDFCPADDEGELLRWSRNMALYMRSGELVWLPDGVEFKSLRHHSEPDPTQLITAQQSEIADLKRRLELCYDAFSALECEGYGSRPVLERGINAALLDRPLEEEK